MEVGKNSGEEYKRIFQLLKNRMMPKTIGPIFTIWKRTTNNAACQNFCVPCLKTSLLVLITVLHTFIQHKACLVWYCLHVWGLPALKCSTSARVRGGSLSLRGCLLHHTAAPGLEGGQLGKALWFLWTKGWPPWVPTWKQNSLLSFWALADSK